MEQSIELTYEMMAVLAILALTIYLFVSEIVRVDVAAISIMVVLGLSGLIPDYEGLVSTRHLFDGFASNAVMSIIAVMIIGAGLDRTGVMGLLASKILQFGGHTETRIITIISTTVAFISSFMQNVGAAALFMPVVSRISNRTRIPLSRLLMPMGFCAILGGTMTMVGSSPLILLNDLVLTSNKSLPKSVEQMETFGLFSVAPIGIALIATGVLYFVILGRFVLPRVKTESATPGTTANYFQRVYGIEGAIYEVRVTIDSPLIGSDIGRVESLDNTLSVIACRNADEMRVAPARNVDVWVGTELAIIGPYEHIQEFISNNKLELKSELDSFSNVLNPTRAGISEIVIPPESNLIGNTIGELRMRKRYGTSVLAVYRNDKALRSDLRDLELHSGDTLVLHSNWADLDVLSKDRNFVVVTDFPRDDTRPHKLNYAIVFFLLALSLVLFSDLRLSVSLLVGAVGMVISGVLSIDEAYESVSWQTVFLLASLIPLGLAVETSGTAAWIAQQTLQLLGGVPIWVLQSVIAILATFFTLVMSNVGATVLLVPLAVNIAIGAGANPAVFALTVALATSNSFLIPTHQVNALIMGPAGYKVADFMRAGGIMTILFLIVVITMLNVVF